MGVQSLAACLTVFVFVGAQTTPARAHEIPIHAQLVMEAQRYMESRAGYYEDTLALLDSAGWLVDEDSSQVRSLFSACSYDARVLPSRIPKVNLLAQGACEVDLYRDMTVDLLPADFNDVYAPFVDVVTDAWPLFMSLTNAITGCHMYDGDGNPLFELPAHCAVLLFNWLVSASDILVAYYSIYLAPFALATRWFLTQNLVDFGVEALPKYNFTSLNHLVHVEESLWAGQNDHRGYHLPSDPSRDFTDYGLERTAGFFLADLFSARINYRHSDALRHYRQNGSQLRENDFEDRPLDEAEFEPMDNMATYGMEAAVHGGNLERLSIALHVAGDASVPFHNIGYGGRTHTHYEAEILSLWYDKRAKWIDHDKIAALLRTAEFDPHLSASEIITNAARNVASQPEPKFSQLDNSLADSDARIKARMSVSVAAIVALLQHFRLAREDKLGPNKSDALPASGLVFLSSYPYPESSHDSMAGESMLEYFWFESVQRMSGSTACKKLRVTFDKRSAGLPDDKIYIYRLTKLGSPESALHSTRVVNELAGKSVSLPDAVGFSLLHERRGSGTWGFRVSNVTCHK